MKNISTNISTLLTTCSGGGTCPTAAAIATELVGSATYNTKIKDDIWAVLDAANTTTPTADSLLARIATL